MRATTPKKLIAFKRRRQTSPTAKPTTRGSVIRFKDPSEPSEAQIQEAMDAIVRSELAEGFGVDLSIARAVWRHYRALVEAPTFPEPFRSALTNLDDGADPQEREDDGFTSFDLDTWKLANDPDIRTKVRPEAVKLAKFWAQNNIRTAS
jgi:hypothetical protein